MIRVSDSATIKAPPSVLYGIIADYQNGHPNIVPRKYFSDIKVEAGGHGAGTKISFKMHVMGRTQEFRAIVSEPEPGRVLVEANDEESGGAVTKFIVDPVGAGEASVVTITTELKPTTRLVFLERLFATRVLRKVYAEELRRLSELAKDWPSRS